MSLNETESTKCQVCGNDLFEWPWAEAFAHVSGHIRQLKMIVGGFMLISVIGAVGCILMVVLVHG